MSNHSATLIFPHQLFRNHPAVQKHRPVYLVEETLFFHQLPFHKKKLQLHRATMKAYAAFLETGFKVHYIEAISSDCDIRKLISRLAQEGINELHFADPVDDWLGRRLTASAEKYGITNVLYSTPYFINSSSEADGYLPAAGGKHPATNRWFLADFYKEQRKKRNILVDGSGHPVGKKWSFDSENRKPLPAGNRSPFVRFPVGNKFVSDAASYVSRHFAHHPGSLAPLPGGGFYPTDFAEAEEWLEIFLKQRFAAFGPYQDAMDGLQPFLFHSVLTPLINTGILDPQTVVQRALAAATEYQVLFSSLEGFLRQVLGWREFVRIVYIKESRRQRTKNFWGFTRKIPESFHLGQTGIDPVDAVILKVETTGYAHHIERLMILGNFMLLCEFDPDEVYRWFMGSFIDAYDWVMVPNVYGMSQFADGGMMSTKPYLSGAGYLLKMGKWKKGDWENTWNSLFWRFLHRHRNYFSTNPRWNMTLSAWDKMDKNRQNAFLNTAEEYLHSLDLSAVRKDNQRTATPGELF